MNTLPDKKQNTLNYWCSWGLQNYITSTDEFKNTFGLSLHHAQAGVINMENTRKYALDSSFLRDHRSELYLMFDLGWDVVPNVPIEKPESKFGSLELCEVKFPELTGTPAERLKKLNEIVKEYSWKGAGIWVYAMGITGAEPSGSDNEDGFDMQATTDYYKERLLWSNYAGIEYWKVDYGPHCWSYSFRKLLTDLGKQYAPNLKIEHALNCGPLNDTFSPWTKEECKNTGRYDFWGDGDYLKRSTQMITMSDVFRTYDVSKSMNIATSLDRIGSYLREFSETGCKTILNYENEPYICAVLGGSMGIMGCAPDPKDAVELEESERCIVWHRLAPPVPVGSTKNTISDEYLTDWWDFKPGSDWMDYLTGIPVKQLAPAAITRNMPLPVVKYEGEKPFVIGSNHENGVSAVATLHRISCEEGKYFPLADVEVEAAHSTLGVFGKYKSLKITFRSDIRDKRLYAQGMLESEAADITEKVVMDYENCAVVLSGELIESLDSSRKNEGTPPAIVIKLI